MGWLLKIRVSNDKVVCNIHTQKYVKHLISWKQKGVQTISVLSLSWNNMHEKSGVKLGKFEKAGNCQKNPYTTHALRT